MENKDIINAIADVGLINPISPEELREAMNKQNNRRKLTELDKDCIGRKCGNCGTTNNLEYHHIVPVALGGSELLSNYCCLCHNCHHIIHSGIATLNYYNLSSHKEKPLLKCNQDLFIELIIKYFHRKTILTKNDIAKQLNISRPTLDKYISLYYEPAINIINSLNNYK